MALAQIRLPHADSGGIVSIMSRPADTDPFSTPGTATAPKAAPSLAVPADEQPRHLLPNDLAGALTRLSDSDIDKLLSAVTKEASRRGRLPPRSADKKAASDTKPSRRRISTEPSFSKLTKGQLSAVRAAYEAGFKPQAIARQFGMSQLDVRMALSKAED